MELRPRRSRCGVCGATHVLLTTWLFSRMDAQARPVLPAASALGDAVAVLAALGVALRRLGAELATRRIRK